MARAVLQELQGIRLDALSPVEPSGSPDPGASPFDASDGLTMDEAVAVGLFLNPALRAARKELGVAEGELVAAGLLPNPQLQVAWSFIPSFTRSLGTSGWDIGLNWAPPRPGERGAKQSRAQARIAEVREHVADEEWRLATDIRQAYATVWAAQARLRLADTSLAFQERVRRFLRDKRELGDASRLEVNLLELEYAERLREREAIAAERDRARQGLSRLLGLPPRAEVPLQGPDTLLRPRAVSLEAEPLEALMIERRPDLLAARQEYEQVEQELRLAYIQRIPWFQFGPTYQRNPQDEHVNGFGIGIGIDLPLANLNQGEIARLEAAREKRREAFTGKVHVARAELAEALRTVAAQDRLVRLFEDVIQPAIDENAALTDAAIELGDVNVLQFVTAQEKVLRSRREHLDTRLEYWKAIFELERTLGARVSDRSGPNKE